MLVVGASSGIGRETAVLFAREGARVMAAARRQDRLAELQQQLAKEGHPIEIATADASVAAQMEDARRSSTVAKFGKIDILVYVTGTNTPDRYLDAPHAGDLGQMISVNLNGAFYATHAVLPVDAERRRRPPDLYRVDLRASCPIFRARRIRPASAACSGWRTPIRVEEKEKGIRTCVICPGLVETEILEKRPVKPSAETLAKALQPDRRRRSGPGRREAPGARRRPRDAVDADVPLILAAD